MLRQFHSLPGLIAALLVMILAISGAVLSVDPALERLHNTSTAAGQLNVGQLAGRVTDHFPGVEQIQRTASGTVIVYYSRDGQSGAETVDPLTGQGLAPYQPSTFTRWVKDLHRSLFMGTPGHGVSGVGALFMLILSVSGALLLARRLGGWRNLLRPLRGTFSQRWHAQVGRLALLGLLLSAVSGLYMAATTFGLIADGSLSEPAFPTHISAGPALPVANLQALQAIDLNDLRELVYPSPGNPNDVFSLRTAQGVGYVDPVSGALLSYQPHDSMHTVYQWVYQLHTAEGLWWLGVPLGLCALCVPLMSVTGILLWWRRRKAGPNIRHNSPAHSADSVILVGSENNTTWGFANTLHAALHQAGHRVHSAAMNEWKGEYRNAQRLFILTATHGDGDAPASASQFLARLNQVGVKPSLPFAVLGLGDRQFPQFCQYAHQVQAAMELAGASPLLALETVNRQSSQAFARWGHALANALGHDLTLAHTPEQPRTHPLELTERIVYGEEVNAPTHVLRFKAHGELPGFQAGDLVGIIPPNSPVPRFYSLASRSEDGVLEICVRKHEGGMCSQWLHGLDLGGSIEAFIQPNPQFRPASGAHPVILIGAGTGIGPLAGFIRNNTARHPMHLYWSGRNPASDFLYEPELNRYLADRRLTALRAAFSQVHNGGYVQDRLISDALALRRLVEKGAQVLVCGSREMAKGVMHALDEVLAPLNLSVLTLKAQGRYREDVY
ncbi:sulfite reductase (NADPH) flavoprotein alpha-component [Pseudomonas antarctica]|uniref:Sulfite reductase (NADPH) flavoprotein alpha-component n=1 Tax=Pseudomonas antarctica TaxID=219572 RepID=A0A1H0ALU8_9PSED|nr:PepSY domain-containing protein [Pseudomonas antarctica]KAF2407353.1 sulfite reductase [NADPH] flavoprotein alpha-component [Pseudomonas antarctica]SDN33786.1 sulfite reductase (NADPH) flavoprotein alpha-component [Pseudomonas antarctica]